MRHWGDTGRFPTPSTQVCTCECCFGEFTWMYELPKDMRMGGLSFYNWNRNGLYDVIINVIAPIRHYKNYIRSLKNNNYILWPQNCLQYITAAHTRWRGSDPWEPLKYWCILEKMGGARTHPRYLRVFGEMITEWEQHLVWPQWCFSKSTRT